MLDALAGNRGRDGSPSRRRRQRAGQADSPGWVNSAPTITRQGPVPPRTSDLQKQDATHRVAVRGHSRTLGWPSPGSLVRVMRSGDSAPSIAPMRMRVCPLMVSVAAALSSVGCSTSGQENQPPSSAEAETAIERHPQFGHAAGPLRDVFCRQGEAAAACTADYRDGCRNFSVATRSGKLAIEPSDGTCLHLTDFTSRTYNEG